MLAVPGLMPCTTPVESTAATAGFELSQSRPFPGVPAQRVCFEPAKSGGG